MTWRFLSLAVAATIVLASSPALALAPSPRPPSATGQTTGILEDSPYRIDIPANWNGELVMLLHGYEPKGTPRQEPWPGNEAAPLFLAKGYAIAAPAYSTQGWAAAEALPDIERLRQHFVATYGEPRRSWLVGFSMGGHLALAGIERQGEHYDGALSLCGVNMPATTLFSKAVLTTLVAFAYYFPGVLPADLAAPDAPPMIDRGTVEVALKSGEAKAALLSKRLDIERAYLPGALMLNYLALREMQARAGGFPADNSDTIYSGFADDAAFNKGVQRHEGAPEALAYVARNANLTGEIDDPVVLLSNVGDPTVPGIYDSVYPQLVKAADKADRLRVLPAVGDGHCDFTPEQIGSAFEALVAKK